MLHPSAPLQRSRGFGFIEFRNADDADEAIYKMDNSTLDGRQINVSFAAATCSFTLARQVGFGEGSSGLYHLVLLFMSAWCLVWGALMWVRQEKRVWRSDLLLPFCPRLNLLLAISLYEGVNDSRLCEHTAF